MRATGWHCAGSADPPAPTLDAFELRESAWSLTATFDDDALARVPPLGAAAFQLRDLRA